MSEPKNVKIGELSPSQLLYSFGIGAIVDMPHLSVIVSGLEDWPLDPSYVKEIQEERLLYAVKNQLGYQVQRLLSLPVVPERGERPNPFDRQEHIGVPVSTFPQWMVCPACQVMAPLSSGLFELKVDYFHVDRTHYEHVNCQRAKNPTVLPARFLVTCENGHLDDFPWVEYVHHFDESKYDHTSLTLSEYGPSGEARDLYVECNICKKPRQLAEAFGRENRKNMPICKGRRPHLHDYDPEGCDLHMRAILLGASNLWFSHVLSAIAIPATSDALDLLVLENWGNLEKVSGIEELATLEKFQLLNAFAAYSLEAIWAAIQRKHNADQAAKEDEPPNLFLPEWTAFTNPAAQHQTKDFRLRPVSPPARYQPLISKVVLAERIREVRALLGFTRIDSPGEMVESEEEEIRVIAPLSRKKPEWVPAIEVHGEGIFIEFNEQEILKWLARGEVKNWESMFFQAHVEWRRSRKIDPPEAGYPGLRYVLLHSFSHALMRQVAMECGYTQASIRERIYSNNPGQPGVPMAGILLYTSAPDSEGTLGGLVSLGEPKTLERHIDAALEACRLCASDPTCAEHMPGYGTAAVHAAACHACMFAPETSCERGNKYLDRAVLVSTVNTESIAFFDHG